FPTPVLAERGLHGVHDRTTQSHADVGEMLAVLRVTQPRIDDAMAADEAHAPVDHRELAMIARVHHADVVDMPGMKLDKLASGLLELPLDGLSHFPSARGVE